MIFIHTWFMLFVSRYNVLWCSYYLFLLHHESLPTIKSPAFHSEAMKELWPDCRSPLTVQNCLFCYQGQAAVPLNLMHFQKMWSGYLHTGIIEWNTFSLLEMSITGHWKPIHCLKYAEKDDRTYSGSCKHYFLWICNGEIPTPFY